ncbi:MAG TPA: hypothetical protein VF233_04830, partial [Nitrososphaeraceae archaeon]
SVLHMSGLFQMILTRCYRSIAPAIGLTTISVKTRVDNMVSGNVMERFDTLVNRHSSAIRGHVLLQLDRMS